MKKLAALIICGTTLAITACGSQATTTEESPSIEKEEITEDTSAEETVEEVVTPSVSEIAKEIQDNVSLVSPMEMSDDFIFNYYGIDTSALEEYSFVISQESISAETIIIIKVADASAIDQLKGQLQAILDEKAMEMENYIPEQYDIIKKSSVKTSGNYVYLVISESADDIQAIIDKYI